MLKRTTASSSAIVKFFVTMLLFVMSAVASADIIFGEREFREDKGEPVMRKVIPVVLPDFPKEENLIDIYAGPTSVLSCFVDESSITIAGNDEIRYTLVTKSKTGAVGIIYEGLRCDTKEYIRYAYGQKNGKWDKPKQTRWRLIKFHSTNQYQATLVDEFCFGAKTVEGYRIEDLIRRIKYKQSGEQKKYTGEPF